VLQAAVAEADLPTDRPLQIVDLGCGNAYLTFAAYRFLSEQHEVRFTGVDQRPEMRERNTALAAELGWAGQMSFVAGSIVDAPDPDGARVDVVLALHACDTATDDALAQAARWKAPVVLASPCCHHDMQRQMSAGKAPSPYGLVARHAILRERLGDVLTDAVRAALLRRIGYHVEVVQFVSAEYTPRNTMIRAVRQPGAQPDATADADYDELVADWGVTPYLQTLLADDLARR
jgi:SAM-dependent methyltransferase